MSEQQINDRVAELRRSFDETFAEPRESPERDEQDFLIIDVAGETFAVRVSELAIVEAHRKIVPVPGDQPNLLGLAGVQGRLVPVYDLAGFLGLGRSEHPDWLAICGQSDRVALAFGKLLAHARVRLNALHSPEFSNTNTSRSNVREAIKLEASTVYILDLVEIVEEIKRQSGAASAEAGSAR